VSWVLKLDEARGVVGCEAARWRMTTPLVIFQHGSISSIRGMVKKATL
jgi:hypothetical protein